MSLVGSLHSFQIVLSVASKEYTSSLTHLFAMHPFSNLCFQGVEKGCIGNKWVTITIALRLLHSDNSIFRLSKCLKSQFSLFSSSSKTFLKVKSQGTNFSDTNYHSKTLLSLLLGFYKKRIQNPVKHLRWSFLQK